MTKADALKNVMDTLTSQRAMLGGPREIRIDCVGYSFLVNQGWSKSAINNNSQTVFLVISSGSDGKMKDAQRVIHGADVFEIDTAAIRSPEETGYWLLPVKKERQLYGHH